MWHVASLIEENKNTGSCMFIWKDVGIGIVSKDDESPLIDL